MEQAQAVGPTSAAPRRHFEIVANADAATAEPPFNHNHMPPQGSSGPHRRGFIGSSAACMLVVAFAFIFGACQEQDSTRVLVLTAADDFRHGSTDAGIEALRQIAVESDFEIDVADSADAVSESNLMNYRAVVFLNTSGDVLDYNQQADFERFIQAGGGYVGIHSAAETEMEWEWYGRLVGAYFDQPISEFPRMTPGVLTVSAQHPASDSIPSAWNHTDEWYRFDIRSADVEVVLQLENQDEPGGSEPIAWRHSYDGGRAFYTALGHNPEVFGSAAFREHLTAGFEYVLGDREPLDYSAAATTRMPEADRFERDMLADSLNEPTELELLGNGNILFAERKGAVKLYNAAGDSVQTIAQLDVHTEFEDGLMGLALDPDFEQNNWVYLYYSPSGTEPQQHLSRFVLRDDSLLMDSEIVMLVVATQRDECCHTGGSVEFGPGGNLFLSTGDDANPFESDGFAPIDERPGRSPFDAQGSSANTNDLRGKILRITPQDDGSYTIPDGNLFAPGTPDTHPEIYVMGNRNPYRISIDQKTGYLYWGEVGPDAAENDSLRGPRGYDEVNQAREAGFFGWPHFVGDNYAYVDYDFASEASGEPFDPESPINDSPNNTGLRELPPAQPAFVWYPYAESPEFPIVGTGGRNAMAGPVFYSDLFSQDDGTFPAYYDGKLFIYDWIRGWVLVATLDADHELVRLEPFMPSVRWSNAIDMAFDEHGILYVVEYGTGWFEQNADARLNRVRYNTGNRRPVARIRADSTVGAEPFTVRFSAAASTDPDGDDLDYSWSIAGRGADRTESPEYEYTFDEAGVYGVVLTVSDADGASATDAIDVRVGNAPPNVDFEIDGNRSFYWDGRTVDYAINVRDPETGTVDISSIDADAIYVAFDYLEEGVETNMLAEGHQSDPDGGTIPEGRQLIDESDCQACHSTTARSIGPSYVDVALRYRDEPDAVPMLAAKIIQGGGGIWGEQTMSAHPQLSEEEASTMVEYILTLTDEESVEPGLPPSGRFSADEHTADTSSGTYVLRARFTDAGADGAEPAVGQSLLILRHPRVQAESFDASRQVGVARGGPDSGSLVKNIYDGSYLAFQNVDLTDIDRLRYGAETNPLHSSGGRIELRLDAPDGRLVSTANVAAPEDSDSFGTREISADVEPSTGAHDLYFVFRNDRGATPEALFLLDWIEFEPRPTAVQRSADAE